MLYSPRTSELSLATARLSEPSAASVPLLQSVGLFSPFVDAPSETAIGVVVSCPEILYAAMARPLCDAEIVAVIVPDDGVPLPTHTLAPDAPLPQHWLLSSVQVRPIPDTLETVSSGFVDTNTR